MHHTVPPKELVQYSVITYACLSPDHNMHHMRWHVCHHVQYQLSSCATMYLIASVIMCCLCSRAVVEVVHQELTDVGTGMVGHACMRGGSPSSSGEGSRRIWPPGPYKKENGKSMAANICPPYPSVCVPCSKAPWLVRELRHNPRSWAVVHCREVLGE